MILEACVGNIHQAKMAEKLGAHQIELCDRLDLDGLSPSFEMVRKTCEAVSIPVKVIVNPKPFDYTYNASELNFISQYINKLNNYSISGIVFGALTPDAVPDLSALNSIAKHTSHPITFHKAVDSSRDILESTAMLKKQGIIKYILSSGGGKTAKDGQPNLLEMKKILEESSISLIAAGSITNENLLSHHDVLDLKYYHGKKIVGNLD